MQCFRWAAQSEQPTQHVWCFFTFAIPSFRSRDWVIRCRPSSMKVLQVTLNKASLLLYDICTLMVNPHRVVLYVRVCCETHSVAVEHKEYSLPCCSCSALHGLTKRIPSKSASYLYWSLHDLNPLTFPCQCANLTSTLW